MQYIALAIRQNFKSLDVSGVVGVKVDDRRRVRLFCRLWHQCGRDL